MRKSVIVVLAVLATLVLALLGVTAARLSSGGDAVAEHTAAALPRLPVSPEDWQGRIDYRLIDRQLTELAGRPEMAGLAVAIVEDGELRFVGTYGVTSKETGEPVVPGTVFRWASLSKTVTGTLAGQMADAGELDLAAPLGRDTTSLRLPDGEEATLTLEQVLSQSTGLTAHAYDDRLEAGEDPATLRRILADAPMQCAPGQCHTYQNVAFDVATEVLGAVADEPFEQAVEQRLFAPLGMNSAGYGMDTLTGAKSWARPHQGDLVRELSQSYWRVPAAAGVSSNIVDLARWMIAEMGENEAVLSPGALALAHDVRVNTPRPYGGALRAATGDAGYGLGWRTFDYGGHRLQGHSGAVDGFRATMLFDPATRTGVVAMWNSNWGFPFRVPFAVLDSYDGRSEVDWLDTSELDLP